MAKIIYKLLVDLTGDIINKVESVLIPKIILNVQDIEKGNCFKSLQGLTSEEFSNLKENQESLLKETGSLGDVARAVKNSDVDLETINSVVLKKADIISKPISDLILEHDAEGVAFVAEAKEEVLGELLNNVQNVTKGKFTLCFPPIGELAKVASVIAKDLGWSRKILKGSVILSNRKQNTGLDWSGELAPIIKANEKIYINKALDLGGFESFEALSYEIYNVVSEAAISGVYGYREEKDEEPEPPYFYIESIDEKYCIICVCFCCSPCEYYRVPLVVADGKIEIEFPGDIVHIVRMFILEDEEIIVQPKGTEPAAPAEPNIEVEAACGGGKKKPTHKANSEDLKKTIKLSRLIKSDFSEKEVLQQVYGIVLEPNDGADGIERKPDAQGDIYSAQEIEQAAHKWLADYQVTGIMHDSIAGRSVVPIESFIAPVDFTVGEETIKKGSWILVAKVDAEIWDAVKKGELNAWSMGGFAVREDAI